VVDTADLVEVLARRLHTTVGVVAGTTNVLEDGGYSVRLQLGDGRTAADVLHVIVAVESELQLRPGAVTTEPDRARRDRVKVTVLPTDPASPPRPRLPLPASITEPAPVGTLDDGRPMLLRIYHPDIGFRHLLIGGRTGSGKTECGLWPAMECWTATDDTLIFFGDRSGGVSSEAWLPCLAVRETTATGITQMLRGVMAIYEARVPELPKRGLTKWKPTPQDPAIIVILDEAQLQLGNDWASLQQVQDAIQVVRKAGISIVLSQPNPVQDQGISPAIREQCTLRACFASPGKAAEWVLGDTKGAHLLGLPTTFSHPGQVILVQPEDEPAPGRGHWRPVKQVERVAAAHAARRPRLDRLSAEAAAKAAPAVFGHLLQPELATAAAVVPAGRHAAEPAAAAAPAARAAGGAPVFGEDGWTRDDDDALVTLLRGSGDGPEPPFGWGPDITGPEVPAGRLPTEQAITVAGQMIRMPSGASVEEIMAATTRSQAWTYGVLKNWREQGVAVQGEDRRWRHLPPAESTTGGDQ
jgi:hypothetical protein